MVASVNCITNIHLSSLKGSQDRDEGKLNSLQYVSKSGWKYMNDSRRQAVCGGDYRVPGSRIRTSSTKFNSFERTNGAMLPSYAQLPYNTFPYSQQEEVMQSTQTGKYVKYFLFLIFAFSFLLSFTLFLRKKSRIHLDFLFSQYLKLN